MEKTNKHKTKTRKIPRKNETKRNLNKKTNQNTTN